MKKVIHIINALQIGGVEVGVLSLLKSKLNTDYKVMAVRGCDKKIYDSLSEDEKSRLYVCNGYFNALLLLIKLKPKVIISSLWRAHLVSLLFKMIKPKTKRVHFVHNARFAHFMDSIITRMSVFMTNFVFCDSKQSQEWLKNVTGYNSSVVVPMNVSFSSEKKTIGFDPINFVFVGRFCKQKNLLKSLEFIKLLNDYGLVATFDLYGRDDGELELLTNYVCNNELSNLVKFHETLLPTNIEGEMRKYNYYLQTSLAEGMAISVYQAIKNGLLPVVTPVGEIKNYTINGMNAFHLEPNNISCSAQLFKKIIDADEIKNFDVGYIVNEDDYPAFAVSFFSEIEKCRDLFLKRNS